MHNLSATLSKDSKKLIVEIDLTGSTRPSASGKTELIASTEGNQAFAVGSDQIKLGVNCYKAKV